jgi:hypothetical protein
MFDDLFDDIVKEVKDNEPENTETSVEVWDTGVEATAYWKNETPDTIWKN